MPFDDSRITCHKDIVRDIMHDDASGSYDDPITDGHSRADGHIAAEPAVFSYRYRMC